MGQDRNNTEIRPAGEKTPSPLGLYIHIPFCEKKCFYCDFYSIENQSQRGKFLSSLVREIAISSDSGPKKSVDTIFFGGGTPSLLTPAEFEAILDTVDQHFSISGGCEFTIECNPGAVDTRYLSDYRSLGANRLSFGVQSFFDDELKFLSRIHNSTEPVAAVDGARRAGFENINIDLMYALPNQTADRVLANLEKAMSLDTPHLSVYALIVEPGTPLFAAVSRGELKPANESTDAAMYETVMSFMDERGYEHYEISNYCKPDRQCRHNLKYWNGEQYLGFGPSAHSYFNNTRWWNVSSLSGYLASLANDELPVSARETLTRSQARDEFIFLSLRQGRLDLSSMQNKFGTALERDFVSDLLKAGYCTLSGSELRLTAGGFVVCDEIAKEIISSHAASV